MNDLLLQLQALAARLTEAQPLIVLGVLAASALVCLWVLRNLVRAVAALLLLVCVWTIFLPGGWPTLQQVAGSKGLRATADCGIEALSSLDYWTLTADIAAAPGCATAGEMAAASGGAQEIDPRSAGTRSAAETLVAPKRAAEAIARRSAGNDQLAVDAATRAESSAQQGCPAGQVQATIAGHSACLGDSVACQLSWQREYARHGFRCTEASHGGRWHLHPL